MYKEWEKWGICRTPNFISIAGKTLSNIETCTEQVVNNGLLPNIEGASKGFCSGSDSILAFINGQTDGLESSSLNLQMPQNEEDFPMRI